MRKILLSTAALLAMGTGLAHAQIKIGMAGPLSGTNAAFGVEQQNGFQLAVNDINNAGGVLGQKLVPVVEDDACDPTQAVTVAKKLVADGVVMVDGHFCSAATIPASAVYTAAKIIEISPASTNPTYTEQGSPYTFRVCGRDDQQGQVAAQYIAEYYGHAKIAIIDDGSAYGKGIADQVRNGLKTFGLPVVFNGTYTPGTKDFSALIAQLQKAGATLVYMGGYYNDMGQIMLQGAAKGFTPQYMSEDAAVTDDLWKVAGTAAEGMLMTFPPPAEKNPAAAKVVAELAALKEDPSGYVLYSYAAVQIWAEAAQKAGTVDPTKVAAELKSGGPWDSVLGPITFDDKGDVQDALYVMYKWHDGKYAIAK